MSGANLASLIDGPARALSRAPAVVLGDEVRRDWAGFARAVAARAGALRGTYGTTPGDSVGLFASNCPEYLEALFSVWHAGGVAVPISSRLHVREAGDLLDAAHAGVCFVTPDLADDLEASAPDGTRLIVLGSPADAAAAQADPIAPVARRPDDDAWIFFTSGTTGRAKGARLSHANLWAMTAAYYADVSPLGPHDAIIHIASLSHASGLMALPFIGRGAAQVLPASGRFDAAELIDLIGAGARSTFFVPPTLLRRLCAAPQVQSIVADQIGTVLVGAAPVRPDDLREGVARLGPCLWNGYGQGESPCTITAMSMESIRLAVATGDDARLGSVGSARWGTRVRVVGEDDRELAPGEVGEVVVDGPTVMSGYLDRPDETSHALRGGWLHTGDLGSFDTHGHLTLVDRVKDVVITGGYNVYPREVEDVLLAHPSVADVAVLGLPDPEWGERVAAFVVASAGATLDTDALDALCLERIARHKRPTSYHVVSELPRNAAGKVLKKELREGVADGAR